jgi:peroxiredoxin Q/BCP
VQLQQSSKALTKAGLQIVAISYDSREVLQRFAEKSKIAFPLLSDSQSTTISAYGIRNLEADSDETYRGIPHPGTFLIDQKGVLRKKLGHEGYRKRHSIEALVKAAQALKTP